MINWEEIQKSKQKDPKLYLIHRKISRFFTYIFYSLNIQPNVVSVAMILTGLLASYVTYYFESLLLGSLVLYFSFILDKCDGDLARIYKKTSSKAAVLDFIYHRTAVSILWIVIGIMLENYYLVLGAVLSNMIEELDLFIFRLSGHKGIHIFSDFSYQKFKGYFIWKYLKVPRTELGLAFIMILGECSNSLIPFLLSIISMSMYVYIMSKNIYQNWNKLCAE